MSDAKKINGRDPKPTPDISAFTSATHRTWEASALSGLARQVTYAAGEAYRPHSIPWSTLLSMSADPVVYLGESAALSPVRAPEIYYLRHPDRRVVATTEEWLWPILPQLTEAFSRAYVFGVSATVLDWSFGDLNTQVKREGGRPRRRVVPSFYSISKARTLDPSAVGVELEDNGELAALHYSGVRYDSQRSILSVWDPQHEGDLAGQGSRRRAYNAWFASQFVALWHSRYLERSVDSPRIGRAPAGKIQIDGREARTTDLLAEALNAVKGGGACVLPSQYEDGRPLWDIDTLDLPDRSGAWKAAHDRLDSQKLLACLVPPSSVGLADASFAGSRIPAQQFVEVVQSIAIFVAKELQKVVDKVHAVNYDSSIPAPEVLAYELPAAKKKLLLEVFKSVVGSPRTLADGSVATLGDLVSDDILDQLGIPRREYEGPGPVAPEAAKAPGRPRDATGAREERRENAREPEGESAVGASGEGVGSY